MGAPASQENLNVWAPTTDGFSVMAAHYHIIVVVLSNFSVYQIHVEIYLKYILLDPTPIISDKIGVGFKELF